jgi:hypothetical protein
MRSTTATTAAERAGMQAVAGIGEALLSVRLAGAGGVVCGVATTGSLSLSLSEDALTTSRHEAGDGRVAHGHDVSLGQGLAVARLWAVAEVPRAGVAIIQNRLSLSLAVTNHGAVPRDAHLWLAWTGMMPGHPIVPAGMAGDVAVAALVRDRRAAFARFLSSIDGPMAGDGKAGSTEPGGADGPGIYTAALPPRGLACGLCSPDVSEEPLVLAALAPGESRVLTWRLAIEAEAHAGLAAPGPAPPPLLSRRFLALTGQAALTA